MPGTAQQPRPQPASREDQFSRTGPSLPELQVRTVGAAGSRGATSFARMESVNPPQLWQRYLEEGDLSAGARALDLVGLEVGGRIVALDMVVAKLTDLGLDKAGLSRLYREASRRINELDDVLLSDATMADHRQAEISLVRGPAELLQGQAHLLLEFLDRGGEQWGPSSEVVAALEGVGELEPSMPCCVVAHGPHAWEVRPSVLASHRRTDVSNVTWGMAECGCRTCGARALFDVMSETALLTGVSDSLVRRVSDVQLAVVEAQLPPCPWGRSYVLG